MVRSRVTVAADRPAPRINTTRRLPCLTPTPAPPPRPRTRPLHRANPPRRPPVGRRATRRRAARGGGGERASRRAGRPPGHPRVGRGRPGNKHHPPTATSQEDTTPPRPTPTG